MLMEIKVGNHSCRSNFDFGVSDQPFLVSQSDALPSTHSIGAENRLDYLFSLSY